jgi:hypothetical protein
MNLTHTEEKALRALLLLDEAENEDESQLWHSKDVARLANLSNKASYQALRSIESKGLTEMGPYPLFRISDLAAVEALGLTSSLPVRPGVRCRLSSLAEHFLPTSPALTA